MSGLTQQSKHEAIRQAGKIALLLQFFTLKNDSIFQSRTVLNKLSIPNSSMIDKAVPNEMLDRSSMSGGTQTLRYVKRRHAKKLV
jgi:hypothetical protein